MSKWKGELLDDVKKAGILRPASEYTGTMGDVLWWRWWRRSRTSLPFWVCVSYDDVCFDATHFTPINDWPQEKTTV